MYRECAAPTRGRYRRASVLTIVAAIATLLPGGRSFATPPRVDVVIPDGGLPAELQPTTMSTRTEVLAAGVTGVAKGGDTEPTLDTPVLAFAQWNDIVFVGGKFANVQRGAGAPMQAQSYLAAFDRATGAWIDTFRPQLNGTVWDMAVVGNTLIIGGQFTSVNGAANTRALAALDAATGQVLPGWRANVALTGSNDRPMVRAIDVEGSWVYIGGNFTRITGLDGVEHSVGRLARVAVSNGATSGTFRPNVAGTVYDIDATTTKIYAVGKFTAVNGIAQSMFTGLSPSTGAVDTALRQKVDSDYRPSWTYQQAVLAVGNEIWITGSQHNTQVYRASDFSLIRNFGSVPYGDGQALAATGGRVYAGNHANSSTTMYSDPPAPLWTPSGWRTNGATSSAPVQWVGAWSAGGSHDYVAGWQPQVGTQYGEGAWELFVDSVGCLWAGGDFNRGTFDGPTARYVGGFAKFCPGDGIAPSVPSSVGLTLRADGVQLVWPASTDERPGPISYDIFRDDTMIATGLTDRTFLDTAGTVTSRYFVRAVDQAGNRSATTSVLRAVDTTKPTTPQNLQATPQTGQVSLTWTAATDNIAVTAYAVYRNNVELLQVTGTTATITGLSPGDHYLQVQAIDAAGNRGNKTSPVKTTTTP